MAVSEEKLKVKRNIVTNFLGIVVFVGCFTAGFIGYGIGLQKGETSNKIILEEKQFKTFKIINSYQTSYKLIKSDTIQTSFYGN